MQLPCFCLVYMVVWVAFFAVWLGFAAAWLGFVAAWMRSAPSIPSEQARSPIWMDSIQTLLPVPYIRTGEKPYLDGPHSDTSARTLHPDRREALFGWTLFRHFCPYPTSGQARSSIWMDFRQTLRLNSSIEFLNISQRMELLFNTGIYRYIRFGKVP